MDFWLWDNWAFNLKCNHDIDMVKTDLYCLKCQDFSGLLYAVFTHYWCPLKGGAGSGRVR